MHVLIVKTSSLGDVVHTLPALTDAANALPGVRFDWVVEEAFAEIPSWHPAVDTVIPVAIRRWRKNIWQTIRSGEWARFKQSLLARRYDLVIDAQGLLKSAWLAGKVNAPVAGYDSRSIREPAASYLYSRRYSVSRELHAVERIRQLFAAALGYPLPQGKGQYALNKAHFGAVDASKKRVMFLHGTTWPTKLWPLSYWQQLCTDLSALGYEIILPWGNVEEQARAAAIASVSPRATVLPRLNLRAIAGELLQCRAVVAVDTGLGHLSAALDIPTVSLYGPTRPALVGAYGQNQIHLIAEQMPAVTDVNILPQEMAALTPGHVLSALQSLRNL